MSVHMVWLSCAFCFARLGMCCSGSVLSQWQLLLVDVLSDHTSQRGGMLQADMQWCLGVFCSDKEVVRWWLSRLCAAHVAAIEYGCNVTAALGMM